MRSAEPGRTLCWRGTGRVGSVRHQIAKQHTLPKFRHSPRSPPFASCFPSGSLDAPNAGRTCSSSTFNNHKKQALWLCTQDNAQGCSAQLDDSPTVAWFPFLPTDPVSPYYDAGSGYKAPDNVTFYAQAVENTGGTLVSVRSLCLGALGVTSIVAERELMGQFSVGALQGFSGGEERPTRDGACSSGPCVFLAFFFFCVLPGCSRGGGIGVA